MGRNRDMMARFQQMQAQMARAQADLHAKRVTATAGGGAVTVVVTGALKIESLEINPEVVDPDDVEMLQDLVIAAVNDALEQVSSLQMQSLAGMAGQMGLGGMM